MGVHPTSERSSPSLPALPGLRRAEWLWAAGLALGPAALMLLLLFPALDVALRSPELHVVIVGLCTLIAVGLAGAVLNAARLHGDGRALLVGAALLTIAAVFSIHAIATPNVIFAGRVAAVQWSGRLSLVCGGLILALSSLSIAPRLSDWLVRRFWLWLGGLGAAWLAYALLVLALLPPGGSAPAPVDAHAHAAAALDPLTAVGLLGLAAYVLAAVRYRELYARRRSAGGLALLGGLVLLGEALLAQLAAGAYNLTFWLYHLLELAGCLCLLMGVLLGLREGAPGAGLLESLLLPGTAARLRERYAQALDQLVERLERGQPLGGPGADGLRQQIGLSEAQLEVFERAAVALAEERQRRRQIEELNAGLRRLDQDRQQLTQLIIHDLKNPITAIGGYLDFLRMSRLNDDQHELVGLAQRSVGGLQALVDDLLDIGRLEAGRLTLQREPLDAPGLLRRCAEQLAHWAAQASMTVAVEAAPALPALSADRRLLERVVLNLLSNAIKHTPAGTRIVLRALPSGEPGCLAIEVADDGPGIAAELAGAIFDPYASGGDGGGQRSSGLGLTLCRLVAEAHGGMITVRSAAGEGTTFRVELPVG